MEKYFTTLVFASLFVATLATANTNKNTETGGSTKGHSTSSIENPTQEAVSACGGKDIGTTCSYIGPDSMTASGTCTKPTKTALLACREPQTGKTVR